MFRSTTTIRDLVLNLAKVIFMLKLSAKLRRYMLFGDVAACHRAACVLCAVHTTHTLLTQLRVQNRSTCRKIIATFVSTNSKRICQRLNLGLRCKRQRILGEICITKQREFNTLRMGLLNCLNAHSRGLTFRHRASCI